MGFNLSNHIRLHKATLLFLLIFLPLFSAIRNVKVDSEKSGLTGNIDALTGINQFQGPILGLGSILVDEFPRNGDSDTWSLNCRLCNVYIRAGVGGAPVAPPEKTSSEKKTNVGAVVGYTFLLVFILVVAFVCIYRNRRSTSQVTARQQQIVMQQGVPQVENPHQGRQEVEMFQGRNQNRGDDKDRKDGRKQVEKKVEGPKGNGDDKEGKKRPQDEVVGQRERVKDGNEGKGLPHKEKVVVQVQPNRVREGKQQEEAPRDEARPKNRGMEGKQQQKAPRDGAARQNKRGMEGKQQAELPRDEGVAKEKKRGMEGKQQDPPRDEGVAKQKKRGREGKQQPPLDEDVGRQYKRGKEEVRNGKGVEAKEEPRKDEVGGQRAKGRDGKQPLEVVLEKGNSLGLPNKYTYTHLTTATNNFDPKNKIGKGGFGNVYKGILPNGAKVAVKCLKFGGRIDDFKNEVEALGRADHTNLVKLIGYCADGITRILVYEYMRNGSLDKWIFGDNPRKTLSWPEMKNIIQGIAQGLVYLHENCEKTILHRDLKPHNIVLDENKNAKLCDFGLAKLLNKNQSSTSTAWAGTPGYMAPEVLKQQRITDRVDVYSFGVVVLEVVFGKRYHRLVSSDKNTNTEEVKLHDLINNLSEEMQRNGKEIEKFGKLAMWCLREKPEERPTMSVTLAAIQTLNAKARRN